MFELSDLIYFSLGVSLGCGIKYLFSESSQPSKLKLMKSVSSGLLIHYLKRLSSPSIHINSNNVYQYPYKYGEREYCMLIPRTLFGPSNILHIEDEDENDVTEQVRQYLGPVENCHGFPLTPFDLGFKQLTFSCLEHTFTVNENENIRSYFD